MTDVQAWQAENGRALSAALASLRARLEYLARGDTTLPAPDAAAWSTPALEKLAAQFSLSAFEQQVLLLSAAVEIDTRIPRLCAEAQADGDKDHPTFALAMTLFPEAAWDALSPHGPLRYWRMLEIPAGGRPLIGSALRVDERIASYIKGLNELDERVTALVADADLPFEPSLPPSQQATALEVSAALAGDAVGVVQLIGSDDASKRLVAASVSVSRGRRLLRLPVDRLPVHVGDVDLMSRLCSREARLLPVIWYVDAGDIDAVGERAQAARQFVERVTVPLFFAAREPWERLGRSLSIDVARPTRVEQERTWLEARIPEAPARRLSMQFNLDVQSIRDLASAPRPAGDEDNLMWDACRRRVRPRLDALAQRLTPQATWDDLVLPSEPTDLLHQIAAQVSCQTTVYETWDLGRRMQRGLGISALFAGESGTGKTLAAEVLANHVRLDLYRVDLSAVVSKYIGETEKNLRRLFDAAEDGSCILFFDEADALFGKRSEVKDSHDRYANIEVNYLLQRMEQFRGLAILATNLRTALDPAFVRRLRFIVTFPFPSVADRHRMWTNAFPPQAPTAALDYDRLARFGLTGAAIRSVAVNAAFLAAADEAPISMGHVLRAAQAEFAKLERPISASAFESRQAAEVPA